MKRGRHPSSPLGESVMAKTLALVFAATFMTAGVQAAKPMIEAPVKRTVRPAVGFDEVLKSIAFEISVCRRLHGVMTKIAAATMKDGRLDITGEASLNPIDKYPMKAPPTPEQLKSLIGKPICDPN